MKFLYSSVLCTEIMVSNMPNKNFKNQIGDKISGQIKYIRLQMC